ncbi:MAG TPA: NmrA family NAD(P)-binding protein [Caulobacteraceae bacterium]|nr:NmrA family NAD(P)-binding protein [Caulobacteraceae bacterium]
MPYNRKPIPESILIFGAGARLGGPLAAFLAREAPLVRLRLATHSAGKADALRERFPSAEVVVADYLDVSSMRRALDGMSGAFVVTPSGTDERPAMTNLVEAAKSSSLVHLLRVVGIQPEANAHRIPQSLRDHGLGLPIQHPIAKRILDDSGLPVTYLNCGATFMDNFLAPPTVEALRRSRTLIWPERLIPFIDPRDVGEAAARLLLSDNHRHIGQLHTLNNGHDILRFEDVAKLMSEVWNEPIRHDSSKEAFFATYSQMGPRRQYLWDFFQYEQDNEVVWARNDFVERMLGRKPTTLRGWLIEHRDAILGAPS